MSKTQVGRVIHPDGSETTIRPVKGGKFTLEELQGAVGGFIELIHLPPGHKLGHHTAYVNEDGIALALPYNFNASILYKRSSILGNLVIVTREEKP